MKVSKRTFITGDHWLYYKLYCGPKISNEILALLTTDIINPSINDKLIDRWFFIRYNDPESHLRIRFHCQDLNRLGSLILSLKEFFQPYINSRQIWDVQLGTYNREIERYGIDNIEITEELFWFDSELILRNIESYSDNEYYMLFVLNTINQYLEIFQLSFVEKKNFTEKTRDHFLQEFDANKKLKEQLSKKFKSIKSGIYSTLNSNSQNKFDSHVEIEKVIKKLSFSKGNPEKSSYLSSFIHMHINRAFTNNQRFYELVVYDLLSKYYNSKFHLLKQ